MKFFKMLRVAMFYLFLLFLVAWTATPAEARCGGRGGCHHRRHVVARAVSSPFRLAARAMHRRHRCGGGGGCSGGSCTKEA